MQLVQPDVFLVNLGLHSVIHVALPMPREAGPIAEQLGRIHLVVLNRTDVMWHTVHRSLDDLSED